MKPTPMEKLHSFMTQRLESLQDELYRDKEGGMGATKYKYDECKFWKEYIERMCLKK